MFGIRNFRKKAFLVVAVVVGFILLDQIYLHIWLSSSASTSTQFQRSLHLDDVRQLLRAGQDASLTTILFDPVILDAWNRNSHVEAPGVCIFLCHVVGPLTFAITGAQLRDKPAFLSRLAQLGFTVTIFENPEGQRSHVFLMRQGSPLHLVVLHLKPADDMMSGGYLRQYALEGPPHNIAQVKQYITKDSWNQMKFDRAYERFSTKDKKIDGVDLVVPSHVESFLTDHRNSHFISCNESRAGYYNLKYLKNESPQDTRFKHKAWKLLGKAKTLLDQLKIPFWLSSGTCLGFYRQCDIIAWSKDVDLGVFIEDFKPSLITEFEKRGLRLIAKFGKVSDSLELSFKEDEVKLDIFFFYTEGATMWNGGTQARTGKKYKYVFPAFTLCWTEFLELKVRVPCQTEEYIRANYGPSWFTPVTAWDWKTSPPNARENGVWPESELSEVIVLTGT
ncbi:ribitol-5-phosphate transferase FKTN-like isoform X1 [Eriocheir sinensis]|uniref:ribitol-5-phosphate transferase FKTN-like isoform X1 n=1 Tax=Eriocheir sinensis TaxID=95602 RepID=UPI0021C6704A|nr:ribitol-5-phosphate transferase FKTN-like isoform X1 [Eriocheir sinensis]XP_050695904.1 ribitol-5-phosphate transferase FKTN-like isoform X1 [Eriocheir sinensis]XP_050695905.1 ribitol-5-phosphate transferase FKTN-like isoform X1 [Eriocheir sinensis]XP_050695906.1 ribitol-5-phosphate transferase FKTN-like isoform X1 [Eriocheir sinensis]XP_050695907.1 ribitol-5-phosphate transferase FKTN-like isoform X1 [Eriocheir sinensis]XP_050695908.1 ribitol-5-phosphate transferase FKTN-like isoform X1 [E